MVNIWDFTNARKVRLTDLNGQGFVRDVVAIFDKEETYDFEDSIEFCVNGVIIGFMQSEIKNIEVLKWFWAAKCRPIFLVVRIFYVRHYIFYVTI